MLSAWERGWDVLFKTIDDLKGSGVILKRSCTSGMRGILCWMHCSVSWLYYPHHVGQIVYLAEDASA